MNLLGVDLNEIRWAQVLAGVLFGFITKLLIEWMRLPLLRIEHTSETGDPDYSKENRPAKYVRHVFVNVENKSPRFFRSLISGSLAPKCRARITFFDLSGKRITFRDATGKECDSTMEGRWVQSDQMVPFQGTSFPPEGCDSFKKKLSRTVILHDLNLYKVYSAIDIFPGAGQLLDIAAKFDDDSQCYGWNNESYFSTPKWRNERWMIPAGTRILFRVQVSCPGGREKSKLFMLDNTGGRKDFRVYTTPFSYVLKVFYQEMIKKSTI